MKQVGYLTSTVKIILFMSLFVWLSSAPLQAQSEDICENINSFVPVFEFNADYYRGQIVAYDAGLADKPNDAELLALRGDANYALDNFQQSVADFKLAIEVDPSYSYAYARLGDAFRQIYDLDSAFEAYNQAIELDPTYAYAYVKRGMLYRKLGDIRKASPFGSEYRFALIDMDTAVSLDPTLALAFARLSEVYTSRREFALAQNKAELAIQANPSNVFAHVVLANVYENAGDFPTALNYVDQALHLSAEKDSDYAYAFSLRADICRQVGSYEEAALAANLALTYDPAFSAAYYQLGRIAQATGDADIAIANLQQSVRFDPLFRFGYELIESAEPDEQTIVIEENVLDSWIENPIAVDFYKICFEPKANDDFEQRYMDNLANQLLWYDFLLSVEDGNYCLK